VLGSRARGRKLPHGKFIGAEANAAVTLSRQSGETKSQDRMPPGKPIARAEVSIRIWFGGVSWGLTDCRTGALAEGELVEAGAAAANSASRLL